MMRDDMAELWILRDTSWSRVGLGLASGLFALTPLVRRHTTRATLLTYLQLPVYMLHQYEEHSHGAFKRDMNALIPPTIGHLTDGNIFVTNILGVWGMDIAATVLAATKAPVAGLLAPYLAVVNAVLHIGSALGLRRYTPGLWAALSLFLPFGAYSIRAISRETRATHRDHLTAVAVTIGLHLLVVVGVLRGRRAKSN